MRNPRHDYIDLGRRSANPQEEVQEYFQQKYFTLEPDWDSVFDLDEQYLMRVWRYYIPGKLYTYPYNPLYRSVLDYFDRQPVMMSIGHFKAKTTKNIIELGVNLNFLPPPFRLNMLEAMWKVFRQQIKENERFLMHRSNRQQRIPMERYNLINKIVGGLGKTAWHFAIRAYIKKRVHPKHVRVIEYDDWHAVPYLEPQRIFGMPLRSIHLLYMAEKNGLLKKYRDRRYTQRELKEIAERLRGKL